MPLFYNSDIVGKKLSVVDELLLLNPHQIPLISMLGFGEAIAQTNHQWFEDEMFGDETKVNGAKLSTDTSVVVVDVEPFRVGHVVKIGDELLLVTAVNTGTKTLTVTRSYGGTTAAAIADQAKIEVMFVEGQEGNTARAGRVKQRTQIQNYTQIFDDTVELSGTATSIAQYGISNLYEYEKQKKLLELSLQLEKALINGVGVNNGNIRQMKGIRNFIQTNVTNASSTALTAAMINDAIQAVYDKGGFQTGGDYKIIVSPKQKRAISAFDNNKLYIQQAENSRGVNVETFVSDFGKFEIAVNNNLASDELILLDANRVTIRPLVDRSFFHKFLGEVGDSTRGILVGEYTLEFQQEKAHARIKGLA
ncbi:DUF5309 family protein [Gottfriedia sp. S16(2024)]|uniref:SU10 major capsid protein n=1 Tax=Gottfriedia sp. S16(2024) TaxID=3162883 RepID=UPI003D1D36E7